MRTVNIALASLVLCAFVASGCSHKLVAHGGETTVSVFHSKSDFDKVESMKSQGGAAGIIGGFGENFIATKVPDNTKIKVLSSQGESTEIEVTEGPNQGLHGFVAKDNVD